MKWEELEKKKYFKKNRYGKNKEHCFIIFYGSGESKNKFVKMAGTEIIN